MRCVLQYVEWHATWWEARQSLHEDLPPEQAEGMAAYARKQASIQRTLGSTFDYLWRSSDKFIALGVGADNDILDLQEATSHNLLQANNNLAVQEASSADQLGIEALPA